MIFIPQNWLRETEKIFRAMAWLDYHKVTLGTYMLAKDIEYSNVFCYNNKSYINYLKIKFPKPKKYETTLQAYQNIQYNSFVYELNHEIQYSNDY